MATTIDYHCLNCGHNFATEVLNKDEAQRLRDKGENVGPVRCPNCGHTDLVKQRAA
jgi:DNA-directed RNA polymerase subunit RPC12/RpoP